MAGGYAKSVDDVVDIANDGAVESPLVAQEIGEQPVRGDREPQGPGRAHVQPAPRRQEAESGPQQRRRQAFAGGDTVEDGKELAQALLDGVFLPGLALALARTSSHPLALALSDAITGITPALSDSTRALSLEVVRRAKAAGAMVATRASSVSKHRRESAQRLASA